jgi:flagellar hook-basal body complex protein FliE
MLSEKTKKTEGNMFEVFLNSAIDNINTTNSYLSDAENEEIKFALGETENTHDLTIALQKASTALQYTVAVRDKLLEAYKEIMNMQI